ncbi:ferritin-like domain-containing protein [Myxococcota bacterium]|nr:ferritin-like domain-containing protein [Myxococcota bacterium]
MSSLPSDLPSDFGAAYARLLGLEKLGVEDMKLMILLETAGEPLYFGLAEGVSSEEARSLLRQNGREETAHAHRLKKAIEILTGAPYTIPTLDENPYGKPPAMGAVTPELLRGMVQAESGGDKLYQTYAAHEPNPAVAELLLQNGREETRHAQRVEQVIAILGG